MEVRIRADRISVVAEPSGGSCEYEESARIVEERKKLEETEEEGEEEEERKTREEPESGNARESFRESLEPRVEEELLEFEDKEALRQISRGKRNVAAAGRRSRLPTALLLAVVGWFLLAGQCRESLADALAANQKYSTRTVTTRYGTLRGVVARSSPNVETYYGVPYATPPLGALRYMPPVTPTPWRGTKFADTLPPACPQNLPVPDESLPRTRRAYLRRIAPLLANRSEDCLYLNLYVPKPQHAKKNEKGGRDASPIATEIGQRPVERARGGKRRETALLALGQERIK
ncbi:hypothetical protein HZH68_014408 [Vespula germanica]|uniref:Carboxylesterase type B domain-containing protein n=1 Tax=Vespula germanica TaxID=30212 RepID=A0A834JFU3_VESGE|nr:hypothetical protein HZH68_014408 [Vespula germanica]